MKKEHIMTSFDNDLNNLNNNLLELGSLATQQFINSIDNLSTQDEKLINQLILKDKDLDELDQKIQQLGFEIIALRSPQAEDLRRVIVALKISTILERIGDYAKNISKIAKTLTSQPIGPKGGLVFFSFWVLLGSSG